LFENAIRLQAYDANAVRVDTMNNEKIGHVKKEMAAKLSPLLAKLEGKAVVEGTILFHDDGFKQPCLVAFNPVV
jgi:hypothetical protein